MPGSNAYQNWVKIPLWLTLIILLFVKKMFWVFRSLWRTFLSCIYCKHTKKDMYHISNHCFKVAYSKVVALYLSTTTFMLNKRLHCCYFNLQLHVMHLVYVLHIISNLHVNVIFLGAHNYNVIVQFDIC